jgi:ketosteroid isomerase-like protein
MIMKKSILFIFTLMLAIFFVACNGSATTDNKTAATDLTGNNSESIKAHIKKEASNFEEEVKRGDSTAIAAHYGSDALVMPPNSKPVKGNDIVNLWGGALRMGVKDLKLDITDISGGGDLYAETGNYEMLGADNKSLDKGKYVVVWKKDNGKWKIYRDIWNSNTAPPASK